MDTCRPAVLPGGQTSRGENESPASQPGSEMKNTILLQAQTPIKRKEDRLRPPPESPAAEDVRAAPKHSQD